MTVLDSGDCYDAAKVIKKCGFDDTTPEISLYTHKTFTREGKMYRFVGWHHLDKKKRWRDIEMEEL